MGAIEYATRKNVELFRCDLRIPDSRPKFSFKIFQLLPVLKAMIEGTKTAAISMIRQLTWNSNGTISKEVEAFQCSELGVVLVEKHWHYHGSLMNRAEMIQSDFDRMNKVFDLIGNDNIQRRFGVINRVSHARLSFHTVGLSRNGSGKVFVNPDDGSPVVGMKGFFSPYGVPYNPSTAKQLVQVILSVALIVQFLQERGIVHNDIRWQNICAVEQPEGDEPVRILLFDFDDAYALNLDAGEKYPGLCHLSLEEHPPKSHVEHTGEVDVWAIGKLISLHALSWKLPEFHRLGADILARFETIDIGYVVSELERLDL